MALSADWRTIMRFALIGFAFGVVGSASSLASDMSTIAVTFLLCPAALLCAPLFAWAFEAAEVGTSGFYLLWAIFALLNPIPDPLIGPKKAGFPPIPARPPTRSSSQEHLQQTTSHA